MPQILKNSKHMKNLPPKTKLDWHNIHKDMTVEGLQTSFQVNREYTLAKDQYTATTKDDYLALAIAIRDRVVERWIETQQKYHKQNVKRVYYLSLEFLIGRLMGNYFYNLGLEKEVETTAKNLGIDLDEVRDQEVDAGLGNGGLGRLAACFLDSMATLGIPAHGYGIRYDYGIFRQKIEKGHQVELPDQWLQLGSPWEFARPEYAMKVRFYGRVKALRGKDRKAKFQWVNTQDVVAVPYDYAIPGYKNDVVNTLRLWAARSTEVFDLEYFNTGDYEQAVHQKVISENISRVLYPNDEISRGRDLRLKQEYFFTAASIADIIRRFRVENGDLRQLPDKVAIQLNDTHPALAIVELMRVLLDDYDFEWDEAWDITRRTFAYTNHTLMPEALERWTVKRLENMLPRHMQIIYEINACFLKEIEAKYPGDFDRVRRMSIIEEGEAKRIRMAYLSVVGSFSVNGVSALHTDLLKNSMLRDFHEFYPGKFNNKTNGITQRRWLLKANPPLSDLITSSIGDKWTTELSHLENLIPLKEDNSFLKRWSDIKQLNKKQLAEYIRKTKHLKIDPHSMFDIQVKRLHEYKRQLMFGLFMISQYLKIKNEPQSFHQPRTFMVGGKAAPGYFMAKLWIKFINNIADVINHDKAVSDKIKVVFLDNYRVSLAEKVFPASDLSEQISTAGMEASGTGNMKFMLNGALTIGTLDGANVEMAQVLENKDIFIFGHKEDEINQLRKDGYTPKEYIDRSPVLEEILRLISENFFSRKEEGIFNPILDSLYHQDPFFICADFDSYCQTQEMVSQAYQDQNEWIKKSITNVARAGMFSSDRTIQEYARDIWKVPSGPRQ